MRAYPNHRSPANLKHCVGLFFSCITLGLGLGGATIVHAHPHHGISLEHMVVLELAQANNAQQAASIARQQYGGKVLKVEQANGGYRVKLLLPSGKVKVVFISSANS